MIFRGLALTSCFFLIIITSSCRPKQEFIVTDEYVHREMGGTATAKNDGARLSSNDRKYYAARLEVRESEITNDLLYLYVKQAERKGFSGSASLVSGLYSTVYGKKISGEPTDMIADKRLELFKSSESLREGDLVFFRTSNDEVVTHVGVYLKNNRFLLGNNRKAAIYNLKKGQWKNNFATAGRLRQ